MTKLKCAFALCSLVLSACSSLQQQTANSHEMLIATPRQAGVESQAAIAKLTDMIYRAQSPDVNLARLYYDRGTRYDSLGLKALAHLDFNRALRIKPDYADAYNFVGIHYTQGEQFIDAFEAFGAALELEPDHDYALLNRGIARYYAGRDGLAVDDLNRFYQHQPSDPYRALWLYLAELEVNPEQAKRHLGQHRTALSSRDWGTHIVDLYLHKSSIEQFLNTLSEGLTSEAMYTERLCEAYFYLGKMAARHDDAAQAKNYFRLALATNVHDFVEHRYALLELKRLMSRGNKLPG